MSQQVGYLSAQKIKVLITSIEDIDNKLIIKYDILESKESQHFSVSLEITSSSGQIIHANALSGDLGNRISGGENKQIIWDYTSEEFVNKGNLNFEVIALVTSANVNLAKSLLYSTIWPGWGLNKMDKSKPYWLMGIAGYGSLAGSIVLNKMANTNYTSYLNNTEDNLNDELIDKSKTQNNISKSLAYTAIGIWGINLVWTAIRVKQKNKLSLGMSDKQNLMFYGFYDPVYKTKSFGLNYRF
jgi:hypothetical protein